MFLHGSFKAGFGLEASEVVVIYPSSSMPLANENMMRVRGEIPLCCSVSGKAGISDSFSRSRIVLFFGATISEFALPISTMLYDMEV